MKIKKYIGLIGGILLFSACSEQESILSPEVPEGMVEVRFALPGTLTASATSGRSQTRAAGNALTRMTEEEFKKRTEYEQLLKGKNTLPLEEGTTLWLLIEGTPTSETTTPDTPPSYRKLKSYVVKGNGTYQSMYPCTVDEKGNVISEEVAPLYLPYGTYTFRALSPARAFLDEKGEPVKDPNSTMETYYQLVKNGQYLISNDERYHQTCMKQQTIKRTDEKVQVVTLNPLINQTAQLKFTVVLDEDNPYLHSVDIAPGGVEISGLQDHYYKIEENGETTVKLWNWSPALKDTLVAYPGNKNEQLIIMDDNPGVTKIKDKLIIETAVLPTDGTSNSVIVLFNLIVNGIPTQYEMMLNQKILRAAFSYHYKGTLTIENGISAIAWQHVSWDTDVELDID